MPAQLTTARVLYSSRSVITSQLPSEVGLISSTGLLSTNSAPFSAALSARAQVISYGLTRALVGA